MTKRINKNEFGLEDRELVPVRISLIDMVPWDITLPVYNTISKGIIPHDYRRRYSHFEYTIIACGLGFRVDIRSLNKAVQTIMLPWQKFKFQLFDGKPKMKRQKQDLQDDVLFLLDEGKKRLEAKRHEMLQVNPEDRRSIDLFKLWPDLDQLRKTYENLDAVEDRKGYSIYPKGGITTRLQQKLKYKPSTQYILPDDGGPAVVDLGSSQVAELTTLQELPVPLIDRYGPLFGTLVFTQEDPSIEF